jgi:hypothetical protein
MEVISAGACLAVFLALYAVLHRRANRGDRHRPIQWGWLAAIIGCAALALLIGVLSR